MSIIKDFAREFWLAAKDSPRLYWATLVAIVVGTIRGVRKELSQIK
jgi:hypothetical protein